MRNSNKVPGRVFFGDRNQFLERLSDPFEKRNDPQEFVFGHPIAGRATSSADPPNPPGLRLRLGVETSVVQPDFPLLSAPSISNREHDFSVILRNNLFRAQGREEIVESIFRILINKRNRACGSSAMSVITSIGRPRSRSRARATRRARDRLQRDHISPPFSSRLPGHSSSGLPRGPAASSKPSQSPPEPFGDARPQPAPSKDVAVDDVVGLVLCGVVVLAQISRSPSTRASVMSERPFHCAALPGNLNGRPSSLQIEA